MAQRLKGQETVVRFTNPDGSQEGLEDVLSFDAEMDMEILRERYLGETADRFDDIFKGITGSMEIHVETQEFLVFQQRVQDRAERRTPASGVFNATSSFQFPNGQRPRLTFENLFFGAMPMTVSGSAAYVATTINWGCSRVRRVL